jgi:translation initiation factor 2B subunit (eIF-2B alpha/beta/delta family)
MLSFNNSSSQRAHSVCTQLAHSCNYAIVAQVGTFQMGIVAKAFNKPFYVAAESYKFARLYPLNQRDLPEGRNPMLK